MSEPKTPNLGLNKIDRSSPSTTYFDLDKYLDQNWEKVDAFAEQVDEKVEETSAQVNSIQERLDTEKRSSVTLEPGLQIVNAERASAFKLEGIKGRTLVNLLGRAGGMESLTGLSRSYTMLALDSINKTTGVSGLKITNLEGASTSSAGLAYTPVTGLKSGSYYVLISDAMNIDAESGLQIGFGGNFRGPYSSAVKSTDKFVTIWAKKQISAVTAGNVDLAVVGSVGRSGFFDSVRLYEISAAEYNALDHMTPEQIAVKYPYVDSIQPVRNPYAIRYGENLLPSLMNASFTNTNNYTIGSYKWVNSLGAEATGYSLVKFNVLPNTNYTFSAETFLNISASIYPLDLQTPTPLKSWSNDSTFTFNTGQNAEINFLWRASLGGYPAELKNPMLTLGTTTKPFKPREDAMLALQTDLYADPLTSANGDEVFERRGQYFKVKKWQMVTVEGSKILSNPVLSPHIGFKTIYPKLEGANYAYSSETATAAVKFDGRILIWGSHEAAGDAWAIDKLNNNFAISVSNTDSGWGDLYTPTADEIKAYFMGWRMFDATIGGSELYNRSDGDRKAWIRISDWSGRVDGVVPTTNAPNWTPYQLLYQLATPTVEPITSEGQLMLIEGNNQVEVGTGIVLREYAPVPANSNPNLAGRREINFTQVPASLLKNKAKSILAIYKNGVQDRKWTISDNAVESYGTSRANIPGTLYDPSATYTVTYFMLDMFPAAPFVGSVAENEKALLTDMNDILCQNAAAVSVVEATINEAVHQLKQQNKRNVWGEIL